MEFTKQTNIRIYNASRLVAVVVIVLVVLVMVLLNVVVVLLLKMVVMLVPGGPSLPVKASCGVVDDPGL